MTFCTRAVLVLAVTVIIANPASGQGVRMERPLPNQIEISGGEWRIRYGATQQAWEAQPQLIVVSPQRAYFSQGPWLRLIDTVKGTVLGRWRFPGLIQAVSDAGAGTVDVRFQLSPDGHVSRDMTVRFNPATADVPQWDNGGLRAYRVAEREAAELINPDAPLTALPLFEELIARDPSAPMFRLMRAKLLRDAGDARADAAFAEIFDAGSNDFTEWFAISRTLEMLAQPEPALAARAYDRAFRDFIGRGRDPRLVDTLIARMILFFPGKEFSTSDGARRSYLDQVYEIAPTSEATDRAWAFHAAALETSGDAAAAALWRARAATSSRESLNLGTLEVQLRHDRGVLIALSSILAAVIFIVTRRVKYTSQLRMRHAAAARSGERAEWTFGALAYWTRRERWALVLVVVVGWLAIGYSRTYAQVMARSFAMPIRVGMISGPENFDRYPPSDERTLLQAISKQVVNDAAEAERLYRSIPQFAESWNNLGVLQARAGNEAESREAFARALAIDPQLGEAIFNATGRPTTQATQTFEKYSPAGMKMMALPARERFLRAFLGPAWTQRYARMWLGPFEVFRSMQITDYQADVLFRPALVAGAALLVFLIIALAVLTLVPRRDATVPPGRATGIIEIAIPGLAAAWQWAGTFVLLTWCMALLAAVLQVWVSSPYFLMAVSQAGVLRTFGYSSAYFDLNPPMALLIGVPIALWIANAVLVRARRTTSVAFPIPD